MPTRRWQSRWHSFAPAVHEVVLLSTCNRVEFYLHTLSRSGVRGCMEFLATYHQLSRRRSLSPICTSSMMLEAVRHLFRVAASLDSMVLGEPQILGQVKAAYLAARAAGRTGVSHATL